MEPSLGEKGVVRAYWNEAPCGTRGIPWVRRKAFFEELERERYSLEPYIKAFARFEQGRGKNVLEIGVGAGTDFVNWLRNGAIGIGVDLTESGVMLTRERVALEGLKADVVVGDAEWLPFDDESFDIVYSYGVLHHSPDIVRAVGEVWRVLRHGGTALVMVYRVPSWTAFLVWGIHCLARGRPWKSPRRAVYECLESPGTKAYTLREAETLFARFKRVRCRPQLSHGDLLLMRPSSKYQDVLSRVLWHLYPRWFVRLTGNCLGLALLIEAQK